MAGRGDGCGRRALLLLWIVAASLWVAQVSAVDVYTPAELSVENGTEAKLPCTFASSEVISSAASVTWSFQAEGSTTSVSFFYYSNGRAYPGQSTQFKDRSSWAGDLNKKDASINIANMQFQDNGTYICDVKNPPDIIVTPGEIKVRVVERGTVVPDDIPDDLSGPSGVQATTIRVPLAEDPAPPGTLTQLTERISRLENLLVAILERVEQSFTVVAPPPGFWNTVLEHLERLERCREPIEQHGQ